MGRKKGSRNASKKEEIQNEIEKESRFNLSIAQDIKKSVVAVFLLAFAVVLLFGFFGQAGVVGKSLNSLTGKAIGWVKWIFPLFLVFAGVILLIKKKTSFYVYKIIGLFIVLTSLTGFLHWFFDLDKMAKLAKLGSGGGYLGFGAAYAATKYFGQAGGLVLIIFLFVIGIIVALDFSLVSLVSRIKELRNKTEEESTETLGIPEARPEESITLEAETPKSEKDAKGPEDEKGNIAKIEFVEGRDQYVDKELEEASSREANLRNSGRALGGEAKRKNKKNKADGWILPTLDLLETSSGEPKGGDTKKNAEIIEKTLKNFGIDVERGEIKVGPAVTQYSFRPAVGVKISKILGLQNDIALSLAAHPIRIEAPIPGKSLIGIEVPNKVSAMVRLRDILESNEFTHRGSDLALALGKDVSGAGIVVGLDKMPHLMVAGATGTGKSVSVNAVITALLYQNSPQELKFIMVDPKRVELSLYNGIPHLLSDVIVENGKVVNALRWAVSEMERRYRLFQDAGSRDMTSYREKYDKGEKRKYTDAETGEILEEELEKLPYIVIVVDELADLMGSHGKEVEGAIVRLAQMARAVGIHLIVSTQRPSVEVITGLIKANITTRIAFQVASQIDSRTILDMAGAEKLIGNGDMLFLSASSPKPKRIQGAFVSESEVKRVVKFIKSQKIEEEIGENISGAGSEEQKNSFANAPKPAGKMDFENVEHGAEEDKLFESAKEEVLRMGKASASLLQRRLRVGYARAARLLDELEERGIVGPSDGAKPREVYGAKNSGGVDYEDATTDQEKRDKWEI